MIGLCIYFIVFLLSSPKCHIGNYNPTFVIYIYIYVILCCIIKVINSCDQCPHSKIAKMKIFKISSKTYTALQIISDQIVVTCKAVYRSVLSLILCKLCKLCTEEEETTGAHTVHTVFYYVFNTTFTRRPTGTAGTRCLGARGGTLCFSFQVNRLQQLREAHVSSASYRHSVSHLLFLCHTHTSLQK